MRTIMFDTANHGLDIIPSGERANQPIGRIVPVAMDSGKFMLHSLYRLIGCSMVEAITLNNRTSAELVIDEEGLLYMPRAEVDGRAIVGPQMFNREFSYITNGIKPSGKYRVFGRAVLVGNDDENGDWCEPTVDQALEAFDLADLGAHELPRSATADRFRDWIEKGQPWREIASYASAICPVCKTGGAGRCGS